MNPLKTHKNGPCVNTSNISSKASNRENQAFRNSVSFESIASQQDTVSKGLKHHMQVRTVQLQQKLNPIMSIIIRL